MIQVILVAMFFAAAIGWVGKRVVDQLNHKKSAGCEKCGQSVPSKH